MEVRGDRPVKLRRDIIVASSNNGSRAASRSKPQYNGNTSISILMIKITFMTPPAWFSISITPFSTSRTLPGSVENGVPLLT